MESQENQNVEIAINENSINANKKNNNIKKSGNQNYGELTREQFELMKRIREETISRTERYSELINESNSNDFLFKIANDNKKKKKLKQIETNKETNSSNNTMDNLENQKKQEIDPNKERIYNSSQPYLFIKGEPFIVLGPDTQYYVWIFSITSFSLLSEKYCLFVLFFSDCNFSTLFLSKHIPEFIKNKVFSKSLLNIL